jgi:hypothetical protein
MAGLRRLGLTYAGEIKSNRVVRGGASPKVPWRKLVDFFSGRTRFEVRAKLDHPSHKKRRGRKEMRFFREATVVIRCFDAPVKVIAVYNDRRVGTPFAYHLSTDRLMSGARLWLLGRARWNIEDMFRDLKQNLSFGRLPCKGKTGSDLAVAIPFAILASLRLEPELWGLDANDRRTIGAKVAEIRERVLTSAVDVVVGRPGSALVKRLRARRAASILKQNPRVKPAASRVRSESVAAHA